MSAAESEGDRVPDPELPARIEMAALPSPERFMQLRVDARESGTQKDLHKLVSAWQAVAKQCNMAFEELTRLAVYRLEVERDLGNHLAQTVHRGGDRAKSPRDALLRDGRLPKEITRKQSRIYQSLAALPEEVFRTYLKHTYLRHVLPSSRGARGFKVPGGQAGPGRIHKRRRLAKESGPDALPAEVIDCIAAIMTPDIVVGHADLRAGRRVDVGNASLDQLTGEVFVAQCRGPARWLAAIVELRRAALIKRAVVALPADPCAEWFAALEHGDWLLCFVQRPMGNDGKGLMLAHIGDRPSAFRLACRSLGVVVRPANAD